METMEIARRITVADLKRQAQSTYSVLHLPCLGNLEVLQSRLLSSHISAHLLNITVCSWCPSKKRKP